MTELDLDALLFDSRVHGPAWDDDDHISFGLVRPLLAELRAARRVVEAAQGWAYECGPPGGPLQRARSKQVLWDAVAEYEAGQKFPA